MVLVDWRWFWSTGDGFGRLAMVLVDWRWFMYQHEPDHWHQILVLLDLTKLGP